MIHLLLVEDDQDAARIIKYNLGAEECYDIKWVPDAASALRLSMEHFDVILLDIMLPDDDGIHLCEKLREHHSCPFLFISCLSDSDTIIRALNTGGDDYITKPFDPGVLHARIQANLRRIHIEKHKQNPNQMESGGVKLDAKNRTATIGEKDIVLLPIEFRILAFLMQNEGTCYRSAELYRYIWGESSYGDNRTVVVHIYNLRKKIEADPQNPQIIRSIWGGGYCFDPQGKLKDR